MNKLISVWAAIVISNVWFATGAPPDLYHLVAGMIWIALAILFALLPSDTTVVSKEK